MAPWPLKSQRAYTSSRIAHPGRTAETKLSRLPEGKARFPRSTGLSSLTRMSAICRPDRSEEHTSELQSLMRISYAVFCLKKKKKLKETTRHHQEQRVYTKQK